MNNQKNDSIFFSLGILSLVFLGSLNSLYSSVSKIGGFSIMLLFFLSTVYMLYYYISSKELPVYQISLTKWGWAYVCLMSFNLLLKFDTYGLSNIIVFIAFIFFVLLLSNHNWTKKEFILMGIAASIYIWLNFLYWIFSSLPIPFASFYINSNILGGYTLYLLFFILLARYYSKNKLYFDLAIIANLILLFASDARSAWLALFGILITSNKFVVKNKFNFNLLFGSIILMTFLFIYVYPNLIEWRYYTELSDLVYKYTGKTLLSGRDRIWAIVLKVISEQPFIGYGPGALPAHFTSVKASSHNLYIQIMLQNGYIGVSFLILYFHSIWKRMWSLKENYQTRLAISFFIGIIIHQSFEISLIQNQLSLGLFQWLIIGIGCSAYYKVLD